MTRYASQCRGEEYEVDRSVRTGELFFFSFFSPLLFLPFLFEKRRRIRTKGVQKGGTPSLPPRRHYPHSSVAEAGGEEKPTLRLRCAEQTRPHVCTCIRAREDGDGEGVCVERVLHVARKLVPNYSDFLINASADDDGACAGLVFLLPRFFSPSPHTHTSARERKRERE